MGRRGQQQALGALSLVLMGGYGMELRQPLGIALIGGLLASQAQPMFTTSALYLLVGDCHGRNMVKAFDGRYGG